MSGFYIGVDGKARKVKGGYIGVDGKARKIKKGYIGDENGHARLCWSASPFDPVFANNTWDEIALACQTGSVPDTWAVGDQKTMTINGVDYAIDIIGKGHDDYSDGTGKAPITFQLHDCYNELSPMNYNSSNNGGWDACSMRNTVLANILTKMPSEVQRSIKAVKKATSSGQGSSTIITSTDKLFLLSEVEVIGAVQYSYQGEGSKYQYYTLTGSRIKRLSNTAINWGCRSPYLNQSYFTIITKDGNNGIATADAEVGVSFAFCF